MGRIMGVLVEKIITHFVNHYFDLCFVLHVRLLLLCYVPPEKPDNCLMNHFQANGSPGWWVRARCRRWAWGWGGMCEIVARRKREGWRRSWRECDWQLTCKLALENLRLLNPYPWTWSVPSVHPSHSWSHFQGHSLEKARCSWDYLDWICDSTGGYRDLLILWLPKTRLALNINSVYPEWAASIYGFSLPSIHGGQLQISPGEAPKFANQHVFYL